MQSLTQICIYTLGGHDANWYVLRCIAPDVEKVRGGVCEARSGIALDMLWLKVYIRDIKISLVHVSYDMCPQIVR